MSVIRSLKRRWELYKIEHQLIPSKTKHLAGPVKPDTDQNDVILTCVLKDGEEFIPAFMAHYQKLGIKHMVFMDNGSSDRTVEMLSAYDNVTVLQTDLSFGKYCLNFRRYLGRVYASNRWFLCVDIDELFDYPHSDQISLDNLISYLNSKKYTAVRALMLDMYSDKKLLKSEAAFKMFDRNDYLFYDDETIERSYPNGPEKKNIIALDKAYTAHGGVRKRAFGTDCYLTKHPLQFVDGSKVLMRTNHKIKGAHIADFSTVLFHYKFTPSFFGQTDKSVKNGNYWNNSAEYKQYKAVLDKDEMLDLYSDMSIKYQNQQQLLDSGLMLSSDDYRKLINQ